jgi:hypothetical protein
MGKRFKELSWFKYIEMINLCHFNALIKTNYFLLYIDGSVKSKLSLSVQIVKESLFGY